MDELIESIRYILGYTVLYTVSIYFILIFISLFGITNKNAYNYLKELKNCKLVILISICYICFFLRVNIFRIVELLNNEIVDVTFKKLSDYLVENIIVNIIVNIIILVLFNIFILCSFVITEKISESIYTCTKKNIWYIIISIVLLLLNYLVYNFCKVFLVLTLCLSLFTVINILVKEYKEKSDNKEQKYGKQNTIEERLNNIIDSEVNGSYINDLRESLKQFKAEDIYKTLSDYHIAQLIKLKYVLKKDIEERKIKFPIKVTLTFLFSGIGGLSTLVGKEKSISFISNQKENITILLSVICLYMIIYLINIYSSVLIQNKTIGTDYLLLLIDSVIESKKKTEVKGKIDENGVVTENNNTT